MTANPGFVAHHLNPCVPAWIRHKETPPVPIRPVDLDIVQRNLAERIAQLPDILTVLLADARDLVIDNWGSWSDDGIDYLYSAAQCYADLAEMARAGGMEAGPELADWLAERPYEQWLATDGDLRWSLAETLAGIEEPLLARHWQDMVDGWTALG